MLVKRTITVEKRIHQCKFSCPYYSDAGHEMRCEHPLAPDDGYIIKHPECMSGFPALCPEARGAKAS
jgi:hypothetical protein